ncbi:dihydrolipoamide acetyltransferase family protein [Sphingobium subterraneum]|uniref:Dihydrolipoamide acetyltransferase component of pyruvate dehydrogenase complex n=1 Tax=Sphingobium subterraneum TaxID=627688 RepID=A0A841IXK1_9SPHN|nr:dihydrolipoamide acetyltransferase family protein [Sphingobium subterraneum]MBB6123679.1 2-oxoisovalerate dehydrogenase E2 component (dihydrolipoyl transacylase) [Sphingobium subterraneum]
MSEYIFKLPDIGEGIAEAEIVSWHVAVGDSVSEDQPLVDMMTDKATVEIESPVSGRIVRLAGEPGEQVAIGAPLVVVEVAGEVVSSAAPEEPAREPEQPVATEPPAPVIEAPPAEAVPASVGPADKALPEQSKSPSVLASPAVRARAKDLQIDLAQVKAVEGRIRHSDLDAYMLYNSGQGYRPASRTGRVDEAIKVIGLRRRIADNMAASKRHIPHFTYVEEIDVTALETLRAQLNAARGERPKLTILPFLITAIGRMIPRFPMMNARFDDEAGVVTRHGSIHMGIATQTDGGLMVPVVRDAQDRNIWQLAAEVARVAEAARNGKATSEELSGSTLTITSLGTLGGIATTPVINRPEVAIIGPNKIVERPMFVPDGLGGERVEKRMLMNLSISCDHRVVDGWDAASFVQALKQALEAPASLLV